MEYTVLSKTGSTRGTAYGMSNKIIAHEGKTHVVWLDQIHKTYVATYCHEAKVWSDPVFVADGVDNHAGAAMTMDSKGFLYLAFGPHHNPMQHAVSVRPNDASAWRILSPFGGVNATYPSLVCDARDVLHACYRGAYQQERPWGLFYQKRSVDGDWSVPVKLVDPQGPPAYVHLENCIHIEGDVLYLSFHLARSNEDNPGDTKGRGFGIMRSRDWGETWETVAGERLDLPVTPDSPCVIEYSDGFDVRIGNVVTCAGDVVLFTLNRREGEFEETFLYRWQRGKWERKSFLPLAEKVFGRCAMSDRCVLSVSKDGVLYAAGVVCKRGGHWADPTNAIVLFTSRDVGETWRAYRVSPEDETVSDWLPSLERCATSENKIGVPQLLYTHGEIGEGCSPDIDTEIRHVFLDEVAERENALVDRAVSGLGDVARLPFSRAQWQKVRGQIERQGRQYAALRNVSVGYDVEPPLVFVPGDVPEGEQQPFALSDANIARPDADDELAFLPASSLARLIAQREISPVELTRLYLDRLARYGEKLKCVVTLTEDLAMEQAKAAEAEIARGDYRGPLHGLPWGAKDLLSTKGIRTTWGATPFRDRVPDEDASVVKKLRQAGAVLVAKLSLGALASGPTWFEGMTRNPWDTEMGSSGSSAGSGAATAAGLVGFSIGSETQGSIVSPSHTCGVVGLRPTYGRVSRYGAMALSWTMDKLGPMCRSVEDCAAVFHAICGPDGKDRSVVDAPFNWWPDVDLSGLRIGYLASEFRKEAEGEDPTGVYAAALDVMRGLGADLQPVSLPDYPADAIAMVLRVEASAMFDDATLRGELDVMTEADKSSWPNTFRAARAVTAVEYLRAQRLRNLLMRDVAQVMQDWDAVLVPRGGRTSLAVTNLTGHPAVILPCGFAEGTPRGLTFLGNLYDEATILAVARAYEQATDWHAMHPIVM